MNLPTTEGNEQKMTAVCVTEDGEITIDEIFSNLENRFRRQNKVKRILDGQVSVMTKPEHLMQFLHGSQVIIATAATFWTILNKGLLKIDQLNRLVIQNCHAILGQYSKLTKIMDFYMDGKKCHHSLPRVLASSPKFNYDDSNLEFHKNRMKVLEETFDSKLIDPTVKFTHEFSMDGWVGRVTREEWLELMEYVISKETSNIITVSLRTQINFDRDTFRNLIKFRRYGIFPTDQDIRLQMIQGAMELKWREVKDKMEEILKWEYERLKKFQDVCAIPFYVDGIKIEITKDVVYNGDNLFKRIFMEKQPPLTVCGRFIIFGYVHQPKLLEAICNSDSLEYVRDQYALEEVKKDAKRFGIASVVKRIEAEIKRRTDARVLLMIPPTPSADVNPVPAGQANGAPQLIRNIESPTGNTLSLASSRNEAGGGGEVEGSVSGGPAEARGGVAHSKNRRQPGPSSPSAARATSSRQMVSPRRRSPETRRSSHRQTSSDRSRRRDRSQTHHRSRRSPLRRNFPTHIRITNFYSHGERPTRSPDRRVRSPMRRRRRS